MTTVQDAGFTFKTKTKTKTKTKVLQVYPIVKEQNRYLYTINLFFFYKLTNVATNVQDTYRD